jgi:hypothetical protein
MPFFAATSSGFYVWFILAVPAQGSRFDKILHSDFLELHTLKLASYLSCAHVLWFLFLLSHAS